VQIQEIQKEQRLEEQRLEEDEKIKKGKNDIKNK